MDETESSEPDDILTRIGRGIAFSQQGAPLAARALFSEVWEEIGESGDPLQRCAVAHSMADVQDDPRDELAWDLRALAAVDSLTDDQLSEAGVAGSARGFYPSLHLNLADVYRRLGEHQLAIRHVQLGRSTLDALPDNGYRTTIGEALDRVERALR